MSKRGSQKSSSEEKNITRSSSSETLNNSQRVNHDVFSSTGKGASSPARDSGFSFQNSYSNKEPLASLAPPKAKPEFSEQSFVAGNSLVTGELSLENVVGLSLKSLSMAGGTNRTYLLGYNGVLDEKISYYDHIKSNLYKDSNNIETVAVYLTMLANEFSLSSGLGRLEGTPLGQSFGSQGKYVQNFLGANSITDSSLEVSSVSAESLADFTVVNQDGENRVSGADKKILLLDGTSVISSNNSVSSFVSNIVTNPTQNSTDALEIALTKAQERFQSGFDFYKKLHLRDSNPVLLTPRGLFSRVIKEFSLSLGNFSGFGGSNQVTKEMLILSLIFKQGRSKNSKKSPPNVLRRLILSVLVKKAVASLVNKDFDPKKILNSSDSSAPIRASLESPAGGDNKSNPSDQLVAAALDAISKSPNVVTTESSVESSSDRIRFSVDDSIIFKSFSASDYVQLADSLGSLEPSQEPDSKTLGGKKTEIDILITEIIEKFSNDKSSLLNKIVQIFLDLHSEALKASKKDNESGTFLNSLFLTKNSQIDGTISLGIIFDCIGILCETFIKSCITKQNSENWKAKSSDFYEGSLPLTVTFLIGEDTRTLKAQKALFSICSASDNNDLRSLYQGEGEDTVVVDLNNEKPQTLIDVDNTVSFQSVVDIVNRLSIERDFTAACLSSAKALLDYAILKSKDIIQIGKQLRGESPREEKIQTYVNFYQNTKYGKDFLNSYTQISAESAREKILYYSDSISSPYGRNPKITQGEVNAFHAIVSSLRKNQTTSKNTYVKFFATVLFPVGFFNGLSLNERSILSLRLNRQPIFGSADYSPINCKFFVSNFLNSKSFDVFKNTPSVSFDDIVNRVILTTYPVSKSGSDFISSFKDKNSAREILRREVVSYLFSKVFSVLSAVDLFQENLTQTNSYVRSENSISLARNFALTYGLPESTFDSCFVQNKNNETEISKDEFFNLTKPQVQLGTQELTKKEPFLNFGESELFYDLFSTIFFQSGRIQSSIFSPPYSDRIVGILSDPEEFTNLQIDRDVTRGSVRFDTYNLSIDKSEITSL